MRKQTKLVAVLAAAALLAIGATMTSFAATGWAEEDGTWVYYDSDGIKVSDEWKKSGNNWFYLDEDGYLATDALIEDDGNYYYVGADGAMVSNQWIAIENEDAGDDDEPAQWWYYFQANGKAYKASDSATTASWKVINGKKYVFDDEARMLFGWIDDAGARVTGDTAWQDGVYYAGDENDGAQTVGWKYLDILDEAWDPAAEVNGELFDNDQTRWFSFRANGKKLTDTEKSINGKKYRFDEYGRMIPEWFSTASTPSQSDDWYYYGDPEDGARVTKGWFKVVPDYFLKPAADTKNDDYADGNASWYYSGSDGKLVKATFKTINGKKYLFNEGGKMQSGLKAVLTDAAGDVVGIKGIDYVNVADYPSDPLKTLEGLVQAGYSIYYFGGGEDGSQKTGRQTASIDGDDYTFTFTKSGSDKGKGLTKVEDNKVYYGGLLQTAGTDDKYVVVFTGTVNATVSEATKKSISKFVDAYGDRTQPVASGKKIVYEPTAGIGSDPILAGDQYYVINTAGTIIKSKSKAKDGDEYIVVVENSEIKQIYQEY
ncbi:MAG: cell wall-binding protein [Lachnospiraceae bacterium]|jgi:glucan-binding YG repeat protein|nr:cell wall-binding protein [Lachnospiraceae bacterium]